MALVVSFLCAIVFIPKTATVELKDVKAKFGTVVNRNALSALSIVSLHYDDEIKFGQAPGRGCFRWAFICGMDMPCIILHCNIYILLYQPNITYSIQDLYLVY